MACIACLLIPRAALCQLLAFSPAHISEYLHCTSRYVTAVFSFLSLFFFPSKDEKLQVVLGHFQKDFEGGVSAENLGKSMYHRSMVNIAKKTALNWSPYFDIYDFGFKFPQGPSLVVMVHFYLPISGLLFGLIQGLHQKFSNAMHLDLQSIRYWR